MPQFRKNKRPGVFLDLVQEDLSKINWQDKSGGNLPPLERKAIKELHDADGIINKSSDKEGNVILLSAEMYEREVKRLLSDPLTYSKLDHNPFEDLVRLINDKLKWAFVIQKRTRLFESVGLQCPHLLDHHENPYAQGTPTRKTNSVRN